MGRSRPRRRAMWSAAFVCVILLLNPISTASPDKKSATGTDHSAGAIPEAVAGPIVRAVVDRLKDANSTDALDKKKTIAQMIDEALEQEFPEEKEEKIGKNYNETAKNSDVCCSCCCSKHILLLQYPLAPCNLHHGSCRPLSRLC